MQFLLKKKLQILIFILLFNFTSTFSTFTGQLRAYSKRSSASSSCDMEIKIQFASSL